MVERPIKKVDRQSQPAAENDSTAKSGEAPKKSNPGRGKDKDKGKRNNKKEDDRSPVNLALMRGPKPSKAKPPIIKADDAEAANAATEDTATEDAAAATETTEES